MSAYNPTVVTLSNPTTRFQTPEEFLVLFEKVCSNLVSSSEQGCTHFQTDMLTLLGKSDKLVYLQKEVNLSALINAVVEAPNPAVQLSIADLLLKLALKLQVRQILIKTRFLTKMIMLYGSEKTTEALKARVIKILI